MMHVTALTTLTIRYHISYTILELSDIKKFQLHVFNFRRQPDILN